MSNKIFLKKDENHHGLITIPKPYSEEEITQFAFGLRSTEVNVEISEHSDELWISEDIWDELSLPYEQTVKFSIKDHILYIHPLVGVFTTHFTGSLLSPLGQRTPEMARLLNLANQYGIYVFLFGPDHVNWEEETINGLFYHNGQWFKQSIPFPNVIYDRIPNRREEKKEIVKGAKQQFIQDYHLPWFNNGFLNKWETYQMLDIHATTSSYLPETEDNISIETIETLIEKHGSIYFKPKKSSHGLGIFQVIKDKDSYYCRFHENGTNKLRRYKSIQDLLHYQLDNKYFPYYTIQQGIKLLDHEDRPMDFRIHTNKDGRGQWKVSAICAKVAGPGSVTTHVAYGGEVKTLQEVFGEKAKDYLERLSVVALIISRILEEQTDGTLAELGLDVGIDQSDNLWIFEANSKPGQMIFSAPALFKQELYSKKLLFDFFTYLGKQSLDQHKNLVQTI